METMKRTFGKVQHMAEHIMAERAESGESAGTVSEAVTVAAAYQIACERHKCHHHPEDSPNGISFTTRDPLTEEEVAAMQGAYDAMWQVIGPADTHTNKAYNAAWDVWSAIMQQDENVEGMQED